MTDSAALDVIAEVAGPQVAEQVIAALEAAGFYIVEAGYEPSIT